MNSELPTWFVTPLRLVVHRYLSYWRSLGRSYRGEQWKLDKLCQFLEAGRHIDLDRASFEAWSDSMQHTTPTMRRNAQLSVRRLCLYRQRSEPDCFVPDPLYFARKGARPIPFIVSPRQIGRLLAHLDACRTPQPVLALRHAVLQLAFVLLYTAGLRRQELVNLTLADADPQQGMLTIRATKFNKTRMLPLSADAQAELQAYLALRLAAGTDQSEGAPLLGHYTLSGGFSGYTGFGLYTLLARTLEQAGIVDDQGRRPRIHDFRHTFAVQALLRWYHEGADVQVQLPYLSMYMGHVSIVSTEYYLHWIPEIAFAASQRFEARYGQLVAGEPS
ncbi:integrase [Xanthomonas campestris]|uniref:tyrosine-type recombinase/integrase n=1 Tax=Xanthomonas sp. CFBP 8151 TaxID=3035310 RepID=UPI00141B199B|nr:tyrosine-type recombinase/integrase [Xanthomonas sp. CFBP 8151]MEB1610313.1 tyrosine-type recombinase/integrase [Xanthomonas campestris pv. campestris]NIJ75010.1 integrase [Xanthomonas sp. CFBP 8151]